MIPMKPRRMVELMLAIHLGTWTMWSSVMPAIPVSRSRFTMSFVFTHPVRTIVQYFRFMFT